MSSNGSWQEELRKTFSSVHPYRGVREFSRVTSHHVMLILFPSRSLLIQGCSVQERKYQFGSATGITVVVGILIWDRLWHLSALKTVISPALSIGLSPHPILLEKKKTHETLLELIRLFRNK